MSINDPDYNIELFWYGFKQSMINFYNKQEYYEHINMWSDILNILKKDKKYDIIELKIREYMSLYAFDLIKNNKVSYYHDDILISNIKRWNKISTNYNFNNNIVYSKILIIFMMYLEIKKMNSYDFLESLEPIENILENNNFDKFIIFALKNNKVKLLELLKTIPNYNLIENIKKLYPNININYNLKISKLVNEIKDKI
jgi:hypothetical protein